MDTKNSANLQTAVAKRICEKKIKIAVAESCTGGMVASALVAYPGISEVFLEGCVTYSNDAKIRRLGVQEKTLENYGAVSEETAKEMAEGIARTSGANIGLATTGIAGPDGGSAEKPVGLVYIGICYQGRTTSKEYRFVGQRQDIREKATEAAFHCLKEAIENEE